MTVNRALLSTLREADGLSHDKSDCNIILIILIIVVVLVAVVKKRRISSSIKYDHQQQRPPHPAIPITTRVLTLLVVVLPQSND